jgi:predicted phage terminase large subunit-like protein
VQQALLTPLTPNSILPRLAKRIEGSTDTGTENPLVRLPDFSAEMESALNTDCSAVLLPYQRRWIEDRSRVKVCSKSRRIGISWADAYESVVTASSSGEAGGSDVFYVGYNREMSEQYISDCAEWANKLDLEFSQQGVQVFRDRDKDVMIFRIRFASGFKISALSAKPTNLRAKKGRFVLDEIAFHTNPQELLKAGLAALMWGGRVAIISTHNGIDNEFNQIVERCKSGELDYSLHETYLDDALNEGLYRQICKVQGVEWIQEKQDDWRAQLFRDYGRSADEELLGIPRRGGNGLINPAWLERCRYSAAELPARAQFEQVVVSVDTAAKAQQINDPWAMLAFGIRGGQFYLLDCLIERMDYPTGKSKLVEFVRRHRANVVLIEDKSTGQALIPELKNSRLIAGSAVIPINPTADKVTRMSVETPAIESGALLLPKTASWLPEYERALLSFPAGLLDPVDATSQFLSWTRERLRRSIAWARG